MIDDTRITVFQNWARGTLELHIFERSRDGRFSYVKQIIMQTDEGSVIPDDQPVHLNPEAAQQLMDQLWNVGIRPSEARDRSDVINAKNLHIQDLEKIMTAFIDVTKRKAQP